MLASLLPCAELAARRVLPGGPDERYGDASGFSYYYLDPQRPFFRRSGPGVYTTQRPGGQPHELRVPKPDDLQRVFIVGESVALPLQAAGISRLYGLLGRALGGAPVEVVGMAMGGYDSDRERLALREALSFEPDLVVVLTGNNESPHPGLPWPPLLRLNRLLRRSRLARALEDRLAPAAPPRLSPAQREQRFERNLEAMARDARRAGVPLLLCTLPINLRDHAPISGPAPRADPDYARAWMALERGRLGAAAGGFAAYASAHTADAYSAYWAGKALDRLGRRDEARRFYGEAARRADPGNACPPSRNEAIRAIAAREGAGLVDLEGLLAGLAPHGLPGAGLFDDNVHWRQELYPLVSLALIRAARARGAFPDAAWDLSWADEEEARLRRAPADAALREQHVMASLLAGVLRATEVRRLDEAALSELEMAERLDPGVAARWLARPAALADKLSVDQYAEVYREDLRRGWPRLTLHVGEAYRRLGRRAEARRLLREAAALMPGDDEPRLSLALLEGSRPALEALARGSKDARVAAMAAAALQP
jgi:tetratricopeptide (TPR) repeat protein